MVGLVSLAAPGVFLFWSPYPFGKPGFGLAVFVWAVVPPVVLVSGLSSYPKGGGFRWLYRAAILFALLALAGLVWMVGGVLVVGLRMLGDVSGS